MIKITKDQQQRIPEACWIAISPGRVNLLGEHVDYNDGLVLPAAINRQVQVLAKQRDDRRVVLHALDFRDSTEFFLNGLEKRSAINGQPLPDWALVPAGVAWAF